MRTLVLYDSIFGNTEKIARAIGSALEKRGKVSVVRIKDLEPEHLNGLDLLVVGSPTRKFRPTEAVTAWLKRLPKDGAKGMRIAAFDTRVDLKDLKSPVFRFIVGRGGYAAPYISKALAKAGGSPAAPAEGFLVAGSEGPLKPGELERTAAWVRAFKTA